jgi:hypothetical protein
LTKESRIKFLKLAIIRVWWVSTVGERFCRIFMTIFGDMGA